MQLGKIEQALKPIEGNAEDDASLGEELIALSRHPAGGSAEFRLALSGYGEKLNAGNIKLGNYPYVIIAEIRKIQSATNKINKTIASLSKAVKKNVKDDLAIAQNLRDLLDQYEGDEEIRSQVWDRIIEIINTLEENNPALLGAPQQVKSAWLNASRNPNWKFLSIAFLSGFLTSEGCNYVEEKTGKNPVVWAYGEIEARLED